MSSSFFLFDSDVKLNAKICLLKLLILTERGGCVNVILISIPEMYPNKNETLI